MTLHLFSATTFAVSHIANILRSVLPVSNTVLVSIDSEGIRFVTEYAHICRIDLTLEKNLFTTYQYESIEETPTAFTVDLTPIVESLSLAHSNASNNTNGTNNLSTSTVQCTISYQRENSPLVLIFEDSKISERCEFSTFLNLELAHLIKQSRTSNNNDTEDQEEEKDAFEIDQNSIHLECIISSDVFFDALKDLKDLETEEVYLYFANTKNEDDSNNNKTNKLFAIISKSIMGNSLLCLPNEASILEKLHINNDNNRSNRNNSLSVFKFTIFQMCFKAIKLSNKCKIQKDFNNLLNLNLLCFRNESGSILPKSYSGTVINFKIFENTSENDVTAVKRFIEKSLNFNDPNVRNIVTKKNNQLVQPSIIQDSGIDVPIFL